MCTKTNRSDYQQVVAIILLTICSIALVTAQQTNSSISNPSATQRLSRQKRVAIFNGQGVVKWVASIAHPVKQADKTQSFWWFYNVQGQWIPTTIPIYWWSFWNTTAFVSTAREWRKDMQTSLRSDETRSWIYDAIETGMEQLDNDNGATCLLRGICEISQTPFEKGNVFAEILNAVLIPTLDNVAEKYLRARDAGNGGADCRKTYGDCSQKIWNWITKVTRSPF
ncbi:uncharacterized protein Dwil_GK22827 [Drosophila willistoni]|uniref:Uncharacterized protein n=2 Tax=Drosophila willistoni TaxID=7260 RepID=B4NF27_DROWI|nr:uncharacterized protein Dwil_GK22827 [Drosophila willistoni]